MSQSTFSHTFANANGRILEPRILFKKNGETVKTLPQIRSAFGVYKIPPKGKELEALNAENERRVEILNAVTSAWDETGDIPEELVSQLLEIS